MAGMAPKRPEPVPTSTNLADLVERDQAAERAAGVTVKRLGLRVADDGTGAGFDLEMQLDLVIDSLDDGDVTDLVIELSFFDDDDLLIDAFDLSDSAGLFHQRVVSRSGKRLHVKYRQSYRSDTWRPPARCQLACRRPGVDTTSAAWRPEENALEVEFVVAPGLPLQVQLARAVVRSGYNDGYVASIHGRVDQRSATADDAEALLARGVLPVGVTLDGFLFDHAGHLVDTFEEVLDAGRAMPVVVHAWHHVGLDLPLATRAVVTVRERA